MNRIYKTLHLGSWTDVGRIKNRDNWIIITVADDATVVGDAHFRLSDSGDKEEDEKYFGEAVEYTLDSMEHKNVLVHCQSGVNRSPSVVISVLCKLKDFSFEESYKFVQEVRPHIKPCFQQIFWACKMAGKDFSCKTKEEWRKLRKSWSIPFTSFEETVDSLYRKFLSRPADPDGLKHYSKGLESGLFNVLQLEHILSSSSECQKRKIEEL